MGVPPGIEPRFETVSRPRVEPFRHRAIGSLCNYMRVAIAATIADRTMPGVKSIAVAKDGGRADEFSGVTQFPCGW